MSSTPFEPCAPQTAVAAASFSTVILAISSTFTESSEAYCSSLAFWKSKFSSGLSKILSSTTISGLASPVIVVTPRRRIVVPAPRLPELATMSRPAISPCSASSAEVKARPSTFSIFSACCETDISFLEIIRPPELLRFDFTTTSFNCVSSGSNLTLKTVWLPMFITFVLSPTYENTSLFLVLLICMEKLPLKSV